MKFLLTYSNRLWAKEKGFPPAGTLVQFTTLEALQGYADASGVGKVIVHESAWVPGWVGYHTIKDESGCRDWHVVRTLPPGWERLTWIEVYNGKRE